MAAKHLLIIIMDDLCWGDLAAHGNPHIATPHLDRFHAESAHLSNYRSGPLCSPARAALLTGRYHHRTKVLDTYCGRSMLDPAETTLADHLHSAGFATGCFGKWHLGDCHPMRPQDKGFQETLTHLAGGIGQPGDHPDNHAREDRCYFDPVLFRNGNAERCEGYCTDIFADATINFFQRHHQDKRCFGYLATNAPHTPLIVADEWADPYRAKGICETHARLYGMVANIDWNVGRIMGALKEMGIADDTCVVFTSDHGPCGGARDPEAGDRWNAGLRGIKGSHYEGGVRVPSLWRLPGMVTAGHDVTVNTHAIDVLPTACSALGLSPPSTMPLDGSDCWSLLGGREADAKASQRPLVMQWHRGDYALKYENYHVVRGPWKLIRPLTDAADELYHLEDDPSETTNRASQEPELVEDLRGIYDRWFDEVTGCKGPSTQDPPAIVRSVCAEPRLLLTENDRRLVSGEGWRRHDLRGFWWLKVDQEEAVSISLQFRDDVPTGSDFIRIGDTIQPLSGTASITLPVGLHQFEAWRDCGEGGFPPGYGGRYVGALYVELATLQGMDSPAKKGVKSSPSM